MKNILKKHISWQCSNWFQRNDNLIQIYSQNGEKIILNEILSKIWFAINYEINSDDLWKILKFDISEEDFINSINALKINKLIYLTDEQDEFDLIFN